MMTTLFPSVSVLHTVHTFQLNSERTDSEDRRLGAGARDDDTVARRRQRIRVEPARPIRTSRQR